MSEEKLYPEHQKLAEVRDNSQAVGSFLYWLGYEKGVFLAHHVDGREFPRRYSYDVQELLAEFFNIDRDELEREKRQMLETVRAQQAEIDAMNQKEDQ